MKKFNKITPEGTKDILFEVPFAAYRERAAHAYIQNARL